MICSACLTYTFPPAKATIKGGGCATLTTEGIGTAGRGAEHA